jgi:SAM-dependent methyltransferase
MSEMLGSEGRVIGIDHSMEMLVETARRTRGSAYPCYVQHVCASAEALPFPSDYFDACYSERLFIHLATPEPALAEIVRVTHPGGRIAVMDPDWGTVSVDTPEVDVERRLAHYYAEGDLKNGFSGRTLYRLFRRQGLCRLHVRVQPLVTTDLAVARNVARLDLFEHYALSAGVITRQELQRWRASLEAAQDAGEFFASLNRVLVVGMKPKK